MRLNKYVAQATGLSRRAADKAIERGDIRVNGELPQLGHVVSGDDIITRFDKLLTIVDTRTIMLNKRVGYVCSRDGQGSRTIYDLLPADMHDLKPVGRLDKDTSGLLLLTNDGALHQELTHPSHEKDKRYQVTLDKPLTADDRAAIEKGIKLEDGLSQLALDGKDAAWRITMHEGRNRQIRRTFAVKGYAITKLHRTNFGDYSLDGLASGSYRLL